MRRIQKPHGCLVTPAERARNGSLDTPQTAPGAIETLAALVEELANRDRRDAVLIGFVKQLTACLEVVTDGLRRIEDGVETLRRAAEVNDGRPAVQWLDVRAAARALNLADWTTRNYLRLGRIAGERASTYRGVDREWRVSVEEIKFIREHGLRPARYPS